MKKTLFWMLFASLLLGATSCSDDNTEAASKPPVTNPDDLGGQVPLSENEEVNRKVHDYLLKMYLWNHEYKQVMQQPDFTKNYEDFFYGALSGLKENTLDYRLVGVDDQGRLQYRLFSFIEQLPSNTARSRGIPQVEKEANYSFGVTGLLPIAIGQSAQDATVFFCVQGVYADSPAARAGLKRGMMIHTLNGRPLTLENVDDSYFKLLAPDGVLDVQVAGEEIGEGQVVNKFDVNLTSQWMSVNPVLKSGVNETYAGHRIGYLNYASFDAGFDLELFEVFKEFRSKQVTDVILDLRYNGGGHTVSADLISTCIAGKAVKDKVFMKLRYNKERMAKFRLEYVEEPFSVKEYSNLKASLADGFLNLKRVYCLVGAATASASELVINALRGIDLEVILIGEPTTGKNVGMEYTDFEVGAHTYRVVPITFQSYNAKNFGAYENGFQPEFVMDETNPFKEEGRFYVYRPFGSNEEPLYAKAIELITGTNPLSKARSAQLLALPKVSRVLPVPVRPGFGGMLKVDLP